MALVDTTSASPLMDGRAAEGRTIEAKGVDGSAFDARPLRGPMRPARLATVRARLSGESLATAFRRLDAAALALAALVAAVVGRGEPILSQPLGAILPLLGGGLCAMWAADAVGGYRFGAREPLGLQLARAVGAALLGALAAVALGAFDWEAALPGLRLWAAAAPLTLALTHTLAWARVRGWRKAGRLTPNLFIVGATEGAARLIEQALESSDVAVLGVFDDRADRVGPSVHGVPVLGKTADLFDHRLLPYVDRVVIALGDAGQARVRGLTERLRLLPNAVTILTDTSGEDREAAIGRVFDTALSRTAGPRQAESKAGAKRAQDLVLAAALFLVAAPVMIAVAVAVRMDSPGPIFFRQKRHGFSNEPITVWKFRSMRRETADARAERQVSVGDERVTAVGRFIRKTSLDELPQLLNVISGEMSLVGPRPHAIGMKTAGEDSTRLVEEYAWRHRIKPGITGWAQINGSRGPVHTAEDVRRRVSLDIAYIERQSFWFDLYIIAMTLPRLLGDGEAVR